MINLYYLIIKYQLIINKEKTNISHFYPEKNNKFIY